MGADALGMDLSADQIAEATDLADGKTEFRVGTVYKHGLAPESFDVSYSRWLLIHLNRPVDAMRSIYAALKPGGLMVCEEADLSAIYTEPPSYPRPVVEGWGAIALALGDNEVAEKAYREALSREPGSGRAYFGLAAALRGQERLSEAEKLTAQALAAWDKADAGLPQLKALAQPAGGR